MKLKEHSALWNDIQNFSFDQAGASINFSRKLATAQNWSPAFTHRAIEEYRRFILLCCINKNGAAPSAVVDEVWHLHLTYTKSYWVDFCKNTLGKEIHHHPSAGGLDENRRHAEWYKETLSDYQHVFGTQPPTDIWPSGLNDAAKIENFESSIKPSSKILAVALILVPFIFSTIVYERTNPFYLTGPDFLVFYLLFAICLFAAYAALKNGSQQQLNEIMRDSLLQGANIFELAHFFYGKDRAIQIGIVDLAKRGLLTVDQNKMMIVHSEHYLQEQGEKNPLAASLAQTANGNRLHYDDIAKKWYSAISFEHPSFRKLNDILKRDSSTPPASPVYFLLTGIGVARMVQGLNQHRPILLLMLEIILLSGIFFVLSNSLSLRKQLFSKADNVLQENLRLQGGDPVLHNFLHYGHSAMAGFAQGILLTAVFASFAPIRRYDDSTNDGSGWSSSNSCGSSSSCGSDSGSSCGSSGCGGCSGGGD